MPLKRSRKGLWALASAVSVVTGPRARRRRSARRARFTATPEIRAALDHISADSLKGHLSFLASDLLEGRDTPSRGLDLAATYIAAQFRRAGLEPAGDDGYFQTAHWRVVEPNPAGVELEIKVGDQTIRPPSRRRRSSRSTDGKLERTFGGLSTSSRRKPTPRAWKSSQAPIRSRAKPSSLRCPTRVRLRAPSGNESRSAIAIASSGAFEPAQRQSVLARRPESPRWTRHDRFEGVSSTPERPEAVGRAGLAAPARPADRLQSATPPFSSGSKSWPPTTPGGTVSIKVGDPVERPVDLRNVAGLLRGSDPDLKDTFVLVTAHYDHVGIGPATNGDRILQCARTMTAAGTVSVVEIASACSRRSRNGPSGASLFLTFFGEEKGLLGSRYYGAHPLVPVAKTVADVNLEQVGRTDSTEGPNVATASMTGFDYSDVGKIFEAAGEREGIKVTKHARNSDAYFGASDNQALADLGVPAHTICVSFAYSDYHGAGDHWEKVDFVNMAKVDRMVGLGLLMIANTPERPLWNAENPKAARYLKAWKKLQGDD